MSVRTYFNYGDPIQSKSLAEAIALPVGVGPVCGFGSAYINNNKIRVYPTGVGDSELSSLNFKDPANYIIRSLIRHHSTYTLNDENVDNPTKFLVIARDGILYRSDEAFIEVDIEGTKGTYDQVLLFAEHNYISEPIDNRVTFRAFWNEGDKDFYTLYKRSLDVYYSTNLKPVASVNDQYDPCINQELSYDSLMNWVSGACNEYANNQRKMVLVGIYGTGKNKSQDNQVDNFALVPYNGKFPVNLPYSFSIHNYLKSSISRLESILDYEKLSKVTNPETGTAFSSIVDYITYLIDQKTAGLQKAIDESILPVGSIVLYDGETVPEGWEEYQGTKGRIVIGYRDGGINLGNAANTVILTSVGSVYDPNPAEGIWVMNLTSEKLPAHKHATGYQRVEYKSSRDPNGDDPIITDFNNRDKSITRNDGVDRLLHEGAAFTSNNLLSDSVNNEQKSSTTYLDKLIPAITLRYIRRKTSK